MKLKNRPKYTEQIVDESILLMVSSKPLPTVRMSGIKRICWTRSFYERWRVIPPKSTTTTNHHPPTHCYPYLSRDSIVVVLVVKYYQPNIIQYN